MKVNEYFRKMLTFHNAVFVCLAALMILIAQDISFALPAEILHWNSNTFENLNTLTNDATMSFKIEYNEIGDIEWYKDDVLAQANSSVASDEYITSWSSYGLKKIVARMNNINGTSIDTTWIVEAVQTGNADIKESTEYHPDVNVFKTYDITNGWSNIPSLYLYSKKPDEWLEYVQERTYVLKANIDARGATFYIDPSTIDELRMQALNNPPVILRVSLAGVMNIDRAKITGWDIQNKIEISSSTQSPRVNAYQNSTLNITSSTLRHIYVFYDSDKSPGDRIDGNYFYEGNPFNLNISDSQNLVINNNTFYHGYSDNVYSNDKPYTYTVFTNNKFIGSQGSPVFGDNVLVGKGSKFIGNEIVYAGWNLVEIPEYTFCRDNILHDNGGNHNGFNCGGSVSDRYFVNDYCYDFTDYSGFYMQLLEVDTNNPASFVFPERNYVINCKAKNVPVGFNFFGGYDCYVYNFNGDAAGGNVQYGSDNIFVRKSLFQNMSTPGAITFRVIDYMPERYGYVKNISLIDTVFMEQNANDLGIYSAESPILNVINCYRKSGPDSVRIPTTYFYSAKDAEMRFYVWLDVLVKDKFDNPVKDAAITVENITDASYPALEVILPPPPPDLWEIPKAPLPRPVLKNFSSLLTLSDGKISKPNYGWSSASEPAAALLFSKLNKSGWISAYKYKITATYNGLQTSATIEPDESWYRQDPQIPTKTITLKLPISIFDGIISGSVKSYSNVPISGAAISNASRNTVTDSEGNYILEDMPPGNYTITASAAGFNVSTQKVDVVSAQNSKLNFKLYRLNEKECYAFPVPYIAGKNSEITLNGLDSPSKVEIYSLDGVLMHEKETTGPVYSFVPDNFPSGVYAYIIKNSKGTSSGKIVIIK